MGQMTLMESFLMFGKYFKRHKFGLIDEMKKRVALHYSSVISHQTNIIGKSALCGCVAYNFQIIS